MNPEVSIFKSCKSPSVERNTKIDEVFKEIKEGSSKLNLILEARKSFSTAHQTGKKCPHYDKIKSTSLNTFTPNATFTDKRNKRNINNLSGLVYLDIDGSTEIDYNNPYIFATWLSLSATGRGVLVKTTGITKDNFPIVYDLLAKELGVEVDPHCKEPSRQVVISYDPYIYINNRSKPYNCESIVTGKDKNIPPTVPKKRKREECDLKGDKLFEGLRWNNLSDYDLAGKEYVVLDEPMYFSKAFIPESIENGKRNTTINLTVHQLKALNPDLTESTLHRIINVLNSRCADPLPPSEIEEIKRKLNSKYKENDFDPIPNYPRSVIFDKKVSQKERQRIGAGVSGLNKVKKTLSKIQECLNDWDLNTGRITNKKIAEIIGMSKKTVDKYSAGFRDQINMINANCFS